MRAQTSQHAKSVAPLTKERRRRERRPARGEVLLVVDSPALVEIRGSLLDVSLAGFRASHRYTALCAGQEVCFCHSLGQGWARVIWNRVLGDRVESGFLIVGTSTE